MIDSMLGKTNSYVYCCQLLELQRYNCSLEARLDYIAQLAQILVIPLITRTEIEMLYW